MTDDDADNKDDDKAADDKQDDKPLDEKPLVELDEQIRRAAQQAEETLGEPGQTFPESGDEESEEADDQTIAPPG